MKIFLLIFPVILVYLKRTPSENASSLKNIENAKLFPFQALHGGSVTINATVVLLLRIGAPWSATVLLLYQWRTEKGWLGMPDLYAWSNWQCPHWCLCNFETSLFNRLDYKLAIKKTCWESILIPLLSVGCVWFICSGFALKQHFGWEKVGLLVCATCTPS